MRLKKTLTLQKSWPAFGTSGATSKSTTGQSTTSMNLWVQSSAFSLMKLMQSETEYSHWIISQSVFFEFEVLQTAEPRRPSHLAWTMCWSSEKLPGSRRRTLHTWACEIVFGHRWLNTTKLWPRNGGGQNMLTWPYSYGVFLHDRTPENWKVKDDVRRLTYNLLRCPPELLDYIASMYEFTKPEVAGQLWWKKGSNMLRVCVKLLGKPCQLCALRTWRAITTFQAQRLTVLKAFGRKSRQGTWKSI